LTIFSHPHSDELFQALALHKAQASLDMPGTHHGFDTSWKFLEAAMQNAELSDMGSQPRNMSFEMQICIKNGDLPIKNGDLPIKNGDFPLKMVIYLLKMVIFPLNQQN
jgi:hypothetical protein